MQLIMKMGDLTAAAAAAEGAGIKVVLNPRENLYLGDKKAGIPGFFF